MKATQFKQFISSDLFSVISLVALFLIIGFDLSDLDPLRNYDFWFEFHEIFYLAAVFTALSVLFNIRHLRACVIGLTAGFISSFTGLFDEILHPFLSDLMGAGTAFVHNPQYTKLFFYGFVILALMISLIRRRRMNVILSLLLVLVNLFLVLNNHISFPDGILKTLIKERNLEMNVFSKLQPEEIKTFCDIYNLHCRFKDVSGIRLIRGVDLPEDMEMLYESLKPRINLPHSSLILDTNKTPSLYRVFHREDQSQVEIFDAFKIKEYWEMNVYYFYRNSSVVSCGWFLFFIALGFIHRKVSLPSGK